MQRSDTLWLSAFGIGFVFTFMVGFIPTGVGLFIFMNVLIAALWYFGRKNEVSKELAPTQVSSWLVNIFTGFYVALTIPLLYRLDIPILVLVLLTQAAILFFGALYYALPSALHIVDLFSIIISPLALGITWLVEAIKSIIDLFKENSNVVKLILKVILYFALSLFVFIMFARLLAQADAEFKKRIDYILDSLRLAEVMGRMVWGVVVSFIAAGLLTIVGTMKVLPLFGTTGERVKTQWEKAFSVVFSKRSDAILPIVVTVPILLLFALYVWVQFTYLFGQDMTSILSKYSFAEYARRGFAELLIVAMLTYPLLSWSMNQAKSEWKLPRFATFGINTGIVSLLVVMLYSLILRMNIYLQNYGPSVLRVYVMVGAVFVGIVLVAYEIFAVLKATKPGYSLIKGRFFGDYTVIGMIAVLSLITTLAVVPWNSVVVNQISAYYKKTGNIDIFQLVQLSAEAQPQVYRLAESLETNGLNEGALVVKAHAVKVRSEYDKARSVSLFTNFFGFNFAGHQILNTIPETELSEITERLDQLLSNKIAATSSKYVNSLIANDFDAARRVYDPQMKANDIQGFAANVSIARDYRSTSQNDSRGYYLTDLVAGNQKTLYDYISIQVTRGYSYQPVTTGNDVGIAAPMPTPITTPTTSSLNLSYSFRNGHLVVTYATVALSYLPDAVNADLGANGSATLSAYGYHSYCQIPTLDVLFSANKGCATKSTTTSKYDYTESSDMIAYDTETMGPFKKSDFVR
jgi:hypothetical protein